MTSRTISILLLVALGSLFLFQYATSRDAVYALGIVLLCTFCLITALPEDTK